MAATVFSPGGAFVKKNKKKVVDINHFHVSLAHAHSSVLKATADSTAFNLWESWLHAQGVLLRRTSARRHRTTPLPGPRLH